MRALTVRQPWAWAIMHGGKDVENRSRNIAGSYRGPVAITAGLAFDPDGQCEVARLTETTGPWPYDGFDFGAVLGVVILGDVHRSFDCWELDSPKRTRCSPWAIDDSPWHLILANPRPLPKPIPVKGRLGLWTLPVDVAAQVEEALR